MRKYGVFCAKYFILVAALFFFHGVAYASTLEQFSTSTFSFTNFGGTGNPQVGTLISPMPYDRTLESVVFNLLKTGAGTEVSIQVLLGTSNFACTSFTQINATEAKTPAQIINGDNIFSFPINDQPTLLAGNTYRILLTTGPVGAGNPYRFYHGTGYGTFTSNVYTQTGSATCIGSDTYGGWYYVDQLQNIEFTTPLDGSQINAYGTTVNIDYENNINASQLNICIIDPENTPTFGNPCESGGQAYSITSGSGNISFPYNVTATSTRVFYASFGSSLDYIPQGVRYRDYDRVSVGFFTPAASSTATSTEGGVDPFLGLECGGFNITDNLKCAAIFLFYPSPSVVGNFSNLTFASSSPFSYLYELNDYLVILRNGTGTTTILTIEAFGTSTEVFNNTKIDQYLPPGTANSIKTWLTYIIWFLGLFVAISDILAFFHVGKGLEGGESELSDRIHRAADF